MDTQSIMDKFGIYFDEVGLSKTYGRLFGFFMTTDKPVSMNQLVEKLQISKSTASVEIRRLLSMGAIEKVLLSDSRADFYQLKKNIWVQNLQQKNRDIKKLQSIITEIPEKQLEDLNHLKEMANYCLFIESELEAIVQKYIAYTNKEHELKQPNSGSYIVQGKRDKKFIVEWSKLEALSETFANKMTTLSNLGIDSFKSVEIDFLFSYPQAMEEDKNLRDFANLEKQALEESMKAKLHKIFNTHPNDLNDNLRSLMKNTYYYFVTIKEEISEENVGFITFMSGGSLPQDEYKITVLAVKDTFRRMGCAGILIHSLKTIGIQYRKILASTRPSNIAAIKAYKKWGFLEDKEMERNASSHFVKGHWTHLSRIE